MLLERRTPWPAHVDVTPQKPVPLEGSAAVVTFIGHATFLIQTAAGNILTDPMYSQRAGPLNVMGPRRVRQPAVLFDDLPRIATVLLSHNHYDHCDLPTLRMIAERFDPIIVTPIGNGPIARSAGFRRIEELDWWQDEKTSALPITLTPAQHFSARGPFDKNRALWGGFMLTAGSRRIYFAGDTAYGPFFRDIRGRLGPIDLALLPIGAYEPRWLLRPVHTDPEEAVRACREVGARRMAPMHWSTFLLSTEPVLEPLRRVRAAWEAAGLPREDLWDLPIGQSRALPHEDAAG